MPFIRHFIQAICSSTPVSRLIPEFGRNGSAGNPCSGASGTASTPPKRPSVRTPPSTQYTMHLITTVVPPHTGRKATYGHILTGVVPPPYSEYPPGMWASLHSFPFVGVLRLQRRKQAPVGTHGKLNKVRSTSQHDLRETDPRLGLLLRRHRITLKSWNHNRAIRLAISICRKTSPRYRNLAGRRAAPDGSKIKPSTHKSAGDMAVFDSADIWAALGYLGVIRFYSTTANATGYPARHQKREIGFNKKLPYNFQLLLRGIFEEASCDSFYTLKLINLGQMKDQVPVLCRVPGKSRYPGGAHVE
ncbi:hypothetical protein DFH08DRAFT_816113 [Mycena albidolilacea]|uniref:Uncharacterized protein n=1 Tax=Mycena albidolilacea TaxID=1033008 RepID=A0AAD6ZL03_9AGAR|nr:hypothetical protein DFH08DRAFT_816113 [Mycena albidolilacea]